MLSSAFPSYLLWGPDLNFFYNDAYAPILGNKLDALGKPFHKVWPELWEALSSVVIRALSGEATYFEDLPLILTRNGFPEQTWFTFSYSPVRDANDEIQGVLCILHETTNRLHLERHLRFLVDFGNATRTLTDAGEIMIAASEMLGRHLSAVRTGYGELEEDGRHLAVQHAWTDGAMESFTGRYCLEDLGLERMSAFKSGQMIRFNAADADLVSGSGPFAPTASECGVLVPVMRGARAVAAIYVFQSNAPDWRDDELSLVKEVAERTWEALIRVRAEAALRASEKQFRQFAEHSTNVLWIADVEARRLEYLSPAFERIWGEPPEAMLRDWTPWVRSIHPEDRESTLSVVPRVIAGEVIATEYRIVRPDGSVRWIHDTFFPMRGDEAPTHRIGGIAVDRTLYSGSVVYVIDANDASRRDVSLLLRGSGYEVKEFTSARAFLELIPVLLAGCVVVNIGSLELEGLTIPRELKARQITFPVIGMGQACGNVSVAVCAMKAGAVDWLEMPYEPDTLLTAIASALAAVRETLEQERAAAVAKARISAMTAREREVLELLLAGGTNKTIGRDLGLSPRTVELHRAHVMERLGARTLPELVSAAIAAGVSVARIKID